MWKLLSPPPLAVEDPFNIVEGRGGEVQPKAGSVALILGRTGVRVMPFPVCCCLIPTQNCRLPRPFASPTHTNSRVMMAKGLAVTVVMG